MRLKEHQGSVNMEDQDQANQKDETKYTGVVDISSERS